MPPLIGVLPCCSPAEFSVKPALSENGLSAVKSPWQDGAQTCGVRTCLSGQRGHFPTTKNTVDWIWLFLTFLEVLFIAFVPWRYLFVINDPRTRHSFLKLPSAMEVARRNEGCGWIPGLHRQPACYACSLVLVDTTSVLSFHICTSVSLSVKLWFGIRSWLKSFSFLKYMIMWRNWATGWKWGLKKQVVSFATLIYGDFIIMHLMC